ncbi:putative polyketide synthase [Aspergillus egyptiacus]|nr:putative polyketide synthase [Aspergillus egyptiacus]
MGSIEAPSAAALQAYHHNMDDPVVIVGMACRLPGGVSSPNDFWEMLINERSGQCNVPKTRFNVDGFYHPEGDRAGVMNTKGGYFLQEDVRQFENSFFGINNLEATYMDPQQRKLLEVVYECFESAGVSMKQAAGADIGVFVGNFTVDFQTMQARDPEALHRYSATGSGTAILSNRISYIFDLRGPSFTLDTACSSSIYCLHSAVSAVRAGECEGAVVAGANLIMGPEQHLGTMKGGVLSPTSTCHTFDASADGYGRAEGVSALYIKRLSAALRDGDPIRAVIRGSAVNANGKTSGITQPSIAGQAEVIRKAYRLAGLNAHDTDYVECHGTGTAVGDPMEVEGLSRVFSRKGGFPLLLGANKTNVGHSEAASGITAVIKAVLAFEHNAIPATIGVTKLNPKLKLDEWNMKVVTKLMSWPSSMRRVSINSFGYGGANAHTILEDPKQFLSSIIGIPEAITYGLPSDKMYLLPFSASTTDALESRVIDLGNRVRQGTDYDFVDLTHTLANRRSKLYRRGYVLASPATAQADLALDKLVTQDIPKLDLAFVFTGQGAQWAEMGRELLEWSPIYRETIDRLDKALRQLPEAPTWSIKAVLMEAAPDSRVGDARFSQPLCTAVQIGLVNVLKSWNVCPRMVAGHSSGEIAAAYAAGLLSEAQAIMIAYYRGHVVGQLKSQGAMVAFGGSADEARELIASLSLQDELVVACVNSPESVTVSGSVSGVDLLLETASQAGKFARKLQTGGKAYHSYMMQEVGAEYDRLIEEAWPTLPFNPYDSDVQFFSSVGVDGPNFYNRQTSRTLPLGYWRQNLENPVQFTAALTRVLEHGKCHIIEIGPHSALQLPIKHIRTSLQRSLDDVPYSPTLVRGKDSDHCMKTLAGELYLRGHDIDIMAVNDVASIAARVIPDLPPYRWSYSQLLWRESRLSSDLRTRKYPRHELLGSEMAAGNGIDRVWKNTVRLNEVPWLGDHKLESQVVFPAAGYIAMAIEAVSQIKGIIPTDASFVLRNVNIASALTVYADEHQQADLYTTVSPARISKAAASSSWYDFAISSRQEEGTVSHCTGRIKLGAQSSSPTITVDTTGYDQWSMGPWYTKLAEEGLIFGPAFQSLTSMKTDKRRVNPAAVSETVITQRVSRSSYEGDYYTVHPLTIDACLQAAIMGGTAGNLNQLRAHLPVFLDECEIHTPSPSRVNTSGAIHTRSQSTGFGTKSIDASLHDGSGSAVINMRSVRLSLFTGKAEREDSSTRRHPCLRVVWKPELFSLTTDDEMRLQDKINNFLQNRLDPTDNVKVSVVSALLDLAAHKNPRLRVLELGQGCDCKTRAWKDLLDEKSEFPRVREWKTAESDEASGKYDVILLPHLPGSTPLGQIDTMLGHLDVNGIIVGRTESLMSTSLAQAGFTTINLQHGITLAIPSLPQTKPKGRIVLLHNQPSKMADTLRQFFKSEDVVSAGLDEVTQDMISQSTVISMLELESPFLPTMTPEEMTRFKVVTDNAADLVWLTGHANMAGQAPDLSLASGLSRALMLEQPALRFFILDVGQSPNPASRFSICRMVQHILTFEDSAEDKEFAWHDGLLHVSRFVPDTTLNDLFSKRQFNEVDTMTLAEASPARLAIQRVGITDSIYFQRLAEPPTEIPSGQVEIEVKAVSLNAKDIYTLSGKVETRKGTAAIEFSGIVRGVASDVSHLVPGDRVVVLAPNNFTTIERVPAWACLKMLPHESFEVMPTLPVIYGTALYALDDRAHLRAGESILVHSGAGAFGTATIAIALQRGATVYTTVSTEEKKDYLVNELGVPRENIFGSRDDSFVEGILKATNGRGVDVIVNSLTGDLLHATWQCCANFGRFVEVGKRDIIDAGNLDMRTFLRNATFTAFDLTELFYHEDEHYRKIWTSKFAEALELYRAGAVKPVPIATFDVSEISQAYRFFSTKGRIGKVVISLENPSSLIRVAHARHLTTFDANKSYLLVGCLGGLGRSLSRWMFDRGARNFTFLGRSGCDKPAARDLVSSLEASGATVQVVRGDIVNADDVQAAVDACTLPIGGVVQAAMGLNEALFSTMSHKAWHTGIQPKWQGTWNLHNALEARDDSQLDFFLLTSSVSGSVGTATESNYCSANGFLDAFARYRRSIGKPIVSIGLGMISEVGYLHENPEIEALLLRKGIQPLNEAELIQVIDLALAHTSANEPRSLLPGLEYDGLSVSHILTGLEPHGIRKLLDRGFDVDNGTMQDPRAVLLAASLDAPSAENSSSGSSSAVSLSSMPWAAGLSAGVLKSMASTSEVASASTLNQAILILVRKRFSNLLLMDLDRIDSGKPIASYGMDSMIASEFRSWFYSVFKVDIPFLEVLNQTSSLQSLSDAVEKKLAV